MKTVYLDKNIYSYFSREPLEPMYDELLGNIKGSKNLLTIYSYAHIEDLMQSTDKVKNLVDLELIESIAKRNYCYYDNDLKKFCFSYYSPKEIYDCQEDIFPLIDSLFATIDIDSFLSDEMKASIGKLKDDWTSSNTENNIDAKSLKLIGSFFPTNLHELSISEIFKESYKGIRAFSTDNSIYRALRANSYDNLNRGQYEIDDSTYDLTKDITESPFKKSFLELVYVTLKQQRGDDEVFRFDFHTTAYILLDLLGFNRDPKVKINNLFVDSNHSYYGAHFDYVVSNDRGFVTKSRALYKLLGLNTKVVYPNEFLEEVNVLNSNNANCKEKLWEKIASDSENFKVGHDYEQFNKKFYQYEAGGNYLYYFDTLIKVVNSENREDYILAKSFNKYLENRIPMKIIEELIEKCLNIFGTDIENKGSLNLEKETDNFVSNSDHILRMWNTGDTGAILEMSGNRLLLTMGRLSNQ